MGSKTKVKTWGVEVLTAADLNAEIDNFYTSPMTLISPCDASLDMNAETIILDADQDTTLKADTDDQLDFTVGGTLMFQITTVIDCLGKRVDLDADNDTSIRASADDIITLETAGVDAWIFDGTTATTVGGLSFTSAAEAGDVALLAQGAGTDLGISVTSKGAGAIKLVPGSTGVVEIDGGTLAGKCLNFSDTWDPADIADGDEVSTTITATGAVLGDFVLVSSSVNLQELDMNAYISSNDVVAVVLSNHTGANKNLGSMTVYARVLSRT
jgi:hypothetical protein